VKETFNIYCDESCHLEHDNIPPMVLGAVWCPTKDCREIAINLRAIKQRHSLAKDFETKWAKVSPAKLDFYQDVLNYFFDVERLHFRAVVIPDKSKLRHDIFSQDHDIWYYKMYFVMLKQIFDPEANYRIYLDIKDTRSQQKVKKLHEILCNKFYDFDKKIIERVQQVRSHEIEILQLADLLIGALAYVHRRLTTSKAKLALIEKIRQRSNRNLMYTTLPNEKKVNILVWSALEW
jgi:hypothetical protein